LSDGELFLGFWTSGLEFGDGFGLFFSEIVGFLSAERFAVVRFVVLSEWIAVQSDDGSFHKGLGSDQFVGGGVVNNIHDPGGPGDTFSGPTEVTVVESKSSKFHVASHSSNGVNSLWGDLGVSGWSSEFELSLLVHLWFSATGLPSFVP